MDYIQLYASQQGLGDGYDSYRELDLYPAEPIRISKSVQSLFDPQATTSAFSQTFRVPHTSSNGKYFEAVFNVNSVDFNTTVSADAYINVNGAFFMTGNIQMSNIFRNEKLGKIEYEIIFLGETSTFGSIVGPKDMSELNLSRYTHFNTYQNVVASWSRQLFNGDIIYPLAEYGYTYDADSRPNVTTLARYDATRAVKGFTNSINPLSPLQLKPMMRAGIVWDQIFEESGFTYTSEFLQSSFFRNIYMLASNVASPFVTPEIDVRAPLDPYSFVFFTAPTQKIPVTQTFKNNANAWNVDDSTFIAPFTTTGYIFRLEDILVQTNWASGNNPITNPSTYNNSVNLELVRNGNVVATQIAYVDPITTGINYLWTTPTPSNNRTFSFATSAVAGDVFELRIGVQSNRFSLFRILNGILDVSGPEVVDPAGLLPEQFKQIEFIKGINDRFKLVWEPDIENPKNFYIEPWNTWILRGGRKDWTNKLNENQDLSISPLFLTQNRQIVYRDRGEGDFLNFLYQQQNKETFGQLDTDSEIKLIRGETVVTSVFAATPLGPIGNSLDFIVPLFAKDSETRREPIQIVPRLLFYNGLQSAPVTWYMEGPTGAVAWNTYPVASMFDSYPFNNLSYDLCWSNVPQFWEPAAVGFDGRTGRSTFTEFWKEWWDYTYDPYSRVMKATFALDSVDVQNLQFNDKIWVKDSWWLVQEIKDFVLGEKTNVEVTLYKLGDFTFNFTSSDAQTRTFFQGSLCYGETGCQACCCLGPTGVSVYSNASTLATSSTLYQDEAGNIFAPVGFYSDGTNAYEVGDFGQIVSVTLCDECTCVDPGDLTEFSVASSTSLCTACCSDTYPNSVFGNGSTLSTSSIIYGDNSGAPLTPFSYHRVSGDNFVAQVGSDGFTIQQFVLCESCICTVSNDPYNVIFARNEELACCITDGSEGVVWGNDPDFQDNSAFWYDDTQLLPVGGTGATAIFSDGEYVYTAGNTLGLDGCGLTSCVDRTGSVEFNYENPTASDVTLNTTYYLSFNNGQTKYWTGDNTQTGAFFSAVDTVNYNPNAYFQFDLDTEGAVGTLDISVELDSVPVFADSIPTPGAQYISPFFGPIGDSASWQVYLTFS